MCGIAGIFGLEGISDVNFILQSFKGSLNHRGPDAFDSYSDDEVLLSHSRLSIIDLDERSNQPFKDSTGRYVLVFNGEIYNYQELKKQLEGSYSFRTESDTEVLMAAWVKWGSGSLKKLNGMFAFALWDRESSELFLCRDRLGIKPLYFYTGNNNLVFGSELRSLLNTGLVPRKLNPNYLTEYLKYQTVHAPRTIVNEVNLIPAGQFLKIDGESISASTYWDVAENSKRYSGQSVKEIEKEIAIQLTSSVERRLISDVPVGAFLSGGIDSSLLVGIVRDRLQKPLDTFAVTFGEKEFSEAKYSQKVAKHFSTSHHEIQLESKDFLNDIPDALLSMDLPSGDGPNSYVVSKAVKKQGITVALSGLGGDELFAGYPFFKQFLDLQDKKYLLSFPKYARRLLAIPLAKYVGGVQGEKMAETLLLPYFDVPHAYPINRRVLTDQWIAKILSGGLGTDSLFYDLKSEFDFGQFGTTLPDLSKVSLAEIKTYMQNVLLRDTDQMSMAHALEVRVPFLDHHLVEYVIGIPDKIKNPTYPKSLLVDSFKGLLPDEIIHRPKMGFIFPWKNWLKTDLKAFSMEGLNTLKESSYFNGDGLDQLFDRFMQDDPSITWSRVWPLITLGHWMKQNEIE